MPWNGSGVYSLPRSWVTDKGGGVAPSAVNFDQQDNDIATAINNCLARDGQNKMTGALDMNTHAISGVTALTAKTISLSDATAVNIIAGDPSVGADLKYWKINFLLGGFSINALNDALVAGATGLSLSRTGNAVSTITLNSSSTLSFTGTLVTPNTSAAEVGYKGSPGRSISASDNTATSDAGKCINLTGGVGQTFTLDADPPQDSIVRVVNRSGSNWTIAASGTLRVNGSTGAYTLGNQTGAQYYHEGGGNWTRMS
jgi:hypothetical protein